MGKLKDELVGSMVSRTEVQHLMAQASIPSYAPMPYTVEDALHTLADVGVSNEMLREFAWFVQERRVQQMIDAIETETGATIDIRSITLKPRPTPKTKL